MKKVVYFILVSLLAFTSCKKDASNPVNTDTVPSPPTLSTPKDTSSNIAVPVVLAWNESSGAKSYTLQVSSSSSFSSFVFNKSEITEMTQQIPDLNYLAVYYWRVSATNSAGTSDWSKVWSFTTTGEAAFVPQLSLPANGAIDQKLSPVLTWNNTSNANSYTLQISTNSSFTSFVLDEDSLTTTTKQINDLIGSTTYYWRVSAVNNFGTKGWSETWSFTTGVAPAPPVLLSPIDGSTDVSLSPTLTWNASTNATSYTLQVSTSSSFSSFVYNQSSTTTNKQITGLTNSTKYFWRVSTTNNFGTSNPSAVWSFTTGTPPEPPTLATPTDGATDISLSPTLTWNASGGATSYTLQVSTNNSFSSFLVNQSVTAVTKQITGLTLATKYYWRVSATGNFGTSNPSAFWSFTTGAVPLAPILLEPQHGSTELSLSPTLTWNSVSGATSYKLQVSKGSSFTNLLLVVFDSDIGNVNNKIITGLKGLTRYYWRLQALNNFGSSAFSNTFYFTTTGACPSVPSLTYEGKLYHTIQIGNQCWLKENLDVGTMISGKTDANQNATIEKYCYDDKLESCSSYGGLYQWNEAMVYNTVEGSQGICPSGWHIPTKTEFETLSATVNNDGNSLKAIGQGAGTNASGFSALLGGYRKVDGNFYSINDITSFWNSTVYDAINARNTSVYGSTLGVINFYDYDKKYGFNIRCLKN
ncbi:MAG: FISUMP domain-containing protein [Ignavibacteria bacterium]|nr:FISUMP domain-containing protein [Ignavibacteria bacterium]